MNHPRNTHGLTFVCQQASHSATFSALADVQSPQQLRSKTGSTTGALPYFTYYANAVSLRIRIPVLEALGVPFAFCLSDFGTKVLNCALV